MTSPFPGESPTGRAAWSGKPGIVAPHDHDVHVLVVESPEGERRSVIFSYACHPTSRSGTLIGGDYVCFAYDHVEAMVPGATAFFLQGCAGDQKTRPVDPASETFVPRSIEEIRDIGVELGDSVARILASDALEPVTGPISVRQSVLGLETEPIDMDLVRAGLKDNRAFVQAWARHLFECVEENVPVPTTIPFEVQTVRFGNTLAVVTLAGEMTVEHGLRLKRELGPHFDNVLALAYTNDIIGYVPVKRQIPEGGYEVWFSQQYWKRTGPYVAATEDRIHAAVGRSLGIP